MSTDTKLEGKTERSIDRYYEMLRQSYSPIYLLFWLPSGKDAFGFDGWEHSPINTQEQDYKEIEKPIGIYCIHKMTNLSEDTNNNIEGFSFHGKLQIEDCELTLRRVKITFKYEPSPDFSSQKIHGQFFIYSNGLYLWRFDIPNSLYKIQTEEEIRKFLRDDFMATVLSSLFDFKWHKGKGSQIGTNNVPYNYEGILNYYQLEFLFDTVFDINLSPVSYFSGRRSASNGDEKLYTIGSILNSISLYAWENEVNPLLDKKRKAYGLRGDYQITDYMDLKQLSYSGKYDDLELLVSRLSYAGMESFIRESNSFPISRCIKGLEFFNDRMKSLTSSGPRDKFKALDLLSLSAFYPSEELLLDYYGEVASVTGKIHSLYEMIRHLSEISQPQKVKNLDLLSRNSLSHAYDISFVEWLQSRSTLTEALNQLQRSSSYINALIANGSILVMLSNNSKNLGVQEDISKINELQLERMQETQGVVIQNIQKEGEKRLELIGIELSAIAVYFALFAAAAEIAIWTISRSLDGDFIAPGSIGEWDIILFLVIWILIFAAIIVFGPRVLDNFVAKKIKEREEKRRKEAEARKETETGLEKSQVHLRPRLSHLTYDTSSLSERITINNNFRTIEDIENTINQWISDGAGIFAKFEREDVRFCPVCYSANMENGSVGRPRYKCSIDSNEYERDNITNDQVRYSFHFEIEIHENGAVVNLVDVRLVVLHHNIPTPFSMVKSQIIHNVMLILGHKHFTDDDQWKEFFQDHFNFTNIDIPKPPDIK